MGTERKGFISLAAANKMACLKPFISSRRLDYFRSEDIRQELNVTHIISNTDICRKRLGRTFTEKVGITNFEDPLRI
jgi:hypothetical protein